MKPITIIFNNIPPSKKNGKQIKRNGRTGSMMLVSSDNHQAWHEVTLWELKKVKDHFAKISRLQMVFFPKDKRPHDLSNVCESVQDILVDAGILKDDNWFVVPKLTLEFGEVSEENPRVEVTIYP